jgi:hypothetical protein
MRCDHSNGAHKRHSIYSFPGGARALLLLCAGPQLYCCVDLLCNKVACKLLFEPHHPRYRNWMCMVQGSSICAGILHQMYRNSE